MIILKITMELNINSFRNQNEKNDTIMITNDNHQNCKMKNILKITMEMNINSLRNQNEKMTPL